MSVGRNYRRTIDRLPSDFVGILWIRCRQESSAGSPRGAGSGAGTLERAGVRGVGAASNSRPAPSLTCGGGEGDVSGRLPSAGAGSKSCSHRWSRTVAGISGSRCRGRSTNEQEGPAPRDCSAGQSWAPVSKTPPPPMVAGKRCQSNATVLAPSVRGRDHEPVKVQGCPMAFSLGAARPQMLPQRRGVDRRTSDLAQCRPPGT